MAEVPPVTTTTLARQSSSSEFRVRHAYEYDRRNPVRWVVSHLLRYPWLLFGFLATKVLTMALFAAMPRLIGVAFDEVLRPEASATRLLVLALLVLGAAVAAGVADLASNFCIEPLCQRLERDARDELTVSLLGKSQTFHNRQRVGDIMARAANDVRQLNPMISPGLMLITEAVLGTVVPLAFVALLAPPLLLFPALFLVTAAIALRGYLRQLNPVSADMRRSFGVMNAGLAETITGIELVKGAAQEEQERRKFTRDARAFRDAFVEQGRVQARYLPILLFGFALTATFAHGLWLLSRGGVTVGELVAVMGLVGSLRGPASLSIFSFSLVQLGLAGAERILELMRTETELDENDAGHSATVAGEIVFEDVAFGYGGEQGQLSLEGLTFRIAPGETVAIVGQTGSGKSTLTQLVNRTYDPTRGRVLIDGVDAREWRLESLRQQISVIEQDVFLFSRSVADNIGFGSPGATRDAVVAAAKAAQAHEFISALPAGYDTVIGERGTTLSGGQRQRLAIARALLTAPRILILDDATSAIDSATEDAIQRAINNVLRGRTALVITHRLSMIRRADKILVLDGGRLVDHGRHEELLSRCALYGRIFARYD